LQRKKKKKKEKILEKLLTWCITINTMAVILHGLEGRIPKALDCLIIVSPKAQ
jgi:hypothetical protein